MGEATVFVSGEGEEPAIAHDDDLDQKLGPYDPDDKLTLRELIGDVGLCVRTYDIYSGYSMLRAVHALQQIAAGDRQGGEMIRTATTALAEIAISGDFDENVEEVEGSPTGFMLEPVVIDRTAYRFASDVSPTETGSEQSP